MLVLSQLSAEKWRKANQFNNYVWQNGYFPPAVQPFPQFPSTSSPQPQPVNPGPSHNPSLLHQYIHLHSPCTFVPCLQLIKIFNPANKKEFQLYHNLCNLSLDIDNPDKLRQALSEQYGDLLPLIDKMEVGYFHQAKKMWIKNWLDLYGNWCKRGKGSRIRVDLVVSNLCQNRPRHSLLQKKKGHWWIIMSSNCMRTKFNILDFKLRYEQRLWLVVSILTWTLPQDMLCLDE